MAHQYSATPPYGAQYPAAPFYSPFAPSAGQPINNATHTLQQLSAHPASSQTPTPLSNTARYDANSHIHPQHVPLPFAPHLNPDFLKTFPPPPPPPPLLPNTHLGSHPHNYMSFPPPMGTQNQPPNQQPFPPFLQPSTPLGGGAFSGPGFVPSPDPQFHQQVGQAREYGDPVEQFGEQASYQPAVEEIPHNNTFAAKSFDGAIGDPDPTPEHLREQTRKNNLLNQNNQEQVNFEIPATQVSPATLTGINRPLQVNGRSPFAQSRPLPELKEKAKAALLSLVPHNIRYNDLLLEGVNPQVLQQLYEELSLNWQVAVDKLDGAALPSVSLPISRIANTTSQTTRPSSLQPPSAAVSGPSSTKVSPISTPASKPSPVISPNMERKDRIAQLLAAKAGKLSSDAASKSQSPAPATNNKLQTSELGTTDAASMAVDRQPSRTIQSIAQTGIVKQKLEQLKQQAIAKALSEQTQNPSSAAGIDHAMRGTQPDSALAQEVMALPTPVREHLTQSGFASMIPGLFMTAADYVEDATSSLRLNGEISSNEPAVTMTSPVTNTLSGQSFSAMPLHSTYSSSSSRKRSTAENSLEPEDYPEAKRQAVQTNNSHDLSMEVDDGVDDTGSDGEIIEDEPAAQGIQFPSSAKLNTRSPQPDPTNKHYINKQMQIDTMRKRIAAMEQRHGPKRGQSYVMSEEGSIASSPTVAMAPQAISGSPTAKVSERLLTNPKIEERVGQTARPLVKATPEQIAERAAHLKAEYLKQRALRQRQLQEGLPVLNDQVTKTQNKLKDTRLELANIRRDLQQYETNITRAREAEKDLIEKVESLEKQITEGISGQKQFSTELNDLKQINKGDASQPPPSPPANIATHSRPSATVNQQVSDESVQATDLVEGLDNGQTQAITEPQLQAASDIDKMALEDQALRSETSIRAAVESEPVVIAGRLNAEKLAADNVYDQEIALSNSSTAATEEAVVEGGEDDSDEAMDESDDESEDSHMSIDDESNDSVSMSDSGSEEYEPAEPELSFRSDEKPVSEEYEPETDTGQEYDGMVQAQNEEYDPSDYEPVEEISAMDTSMPATPGVVQASSSTPFSFGAQQTITIMPEASSAVTQTHADVAKPQAHDQEKRLQLLEEDTLTKPQQTPSDSGMDGPQVLGATEPSTVRYVPYQSLLNSFKSYRFHPTFNENVKNGYRSLTYSHKIDPKLPLCPMELDGVVCTDPQCQDQHFSSMALPDEKILVQMSSASHIKDKELRDQYLIGLKQVIARLRQDGVKDFSAVADALSQYRRDWTAAQTRLY